MKGHDPIRTSSCGRQIRPGSVGATCIFVCYLIFAVGIWLAYLWLAFSRPLVASSASLGRLIEGSSSVADLPRRIEADNSTASGPVGTILDESAPEPEVAVSSSSMHSHNPSVSGPLLLQPIGYTERKMLVLDIQRELVRAGCYRGALDGLWGADTKRAISGFILAANARLPSERPDHILLSLIRGHTRVFCGNKRSANQELVAPLELNPRRDRPTGLMAIGGPNPETDESLANPGARAVLSDESEVSRSRKKSDRRGDSGSYDRRPSRIFRARRSVNDLLIHPLGRF